VIISTTKNTHTTYTKLHIKQQIHSAAISTVKNTSCCCCSRYYYYY